MPTKNKKLIKNKLLTFSILIVALTVIPSTLLTSLFARKLITDEVLTEKQIVVDEDTAALESNLNYYKLVVVSVKEFPPIQGIARSKDSGIDPQDGSTLASWKDRLQQIFLSIAGTDPDIYQMRYLDEEGNEIVRINSDRGNAEIVKEEDLQNKGTRYYFTNTMLLDQNEIYISPIDLNVEDGVLEVPHKPVLRLATPVFDELTGERKGIIIINVEATQFFDQVKVGEGELLIIIDEKGQYLTHPDNEKTFSLQLETSYNYFDEHPELSKNLLVQDKRIHRDLEDNETRIWKKFVYDTNDPSRYLVVIDVVSDDVLFSSLQGFTTTSIIIGMATMALGVLAALQITKGFTRPMKQLVDAAKEISDGNLNYHTEVSTQDEFQELAEYFNKMVDQLNVTWDEQEKLLTDRTEKLTKINRHMTGREIKMIELKKKIKELEERLNNEQK